MSEHAGEWNSLPCITIAAAHLECSGPSWRIANLGGRVDGFDGVGTAVFGTDLRF